MGCQLNTYFSFTRFTSTFLLWQVGEREDNPTDMKHDFANSTIKEVGILLKRQVTHTTTVELSVGVCRPSCFNAVLVSTRSRLEHAFL